MPSKLKLKVHNPSGLPLIDYRDLRDLQGDFKEMDEVSYHKLLNTLKEDGFDMPLAVWRDQSEGVDYIFDGHGRIKLLAKEEATPYKLPYWLIHADNKKEAAKKLLRFNSEYHKKTQEGFDSFMETFGIDEGFIKEFTAIRGIYTYEIDPIQFNDFFEETEEKRSSGDETQKSLILHFDKLVYEKILERFDEIRQEKETNEQIIIRLFAGS